MNELTDYYYPQMGQPNGPPAPAHTTTYRSTDAEVRELREKIEQLKKEKEQKDAQIASLHNAISTQRLFSGMALTRWKITAPGICYLQSFSEGFSRLIAHNPTILHACFTCVQMYRAREYSSTQKFLRIVGSGRIDSLGVMVPLLRGTGEVISVFSMMFIEFESGLPAFATICMNSLDTHPSAYWEPTMVKLRDFSSVQPKSTNQKYSQHDTYQQPHATYATINAPPHYEQPIDSFDSLGPSESDEFSQRVLLNFQP